SRTQQLRHDVERDVASMRLAVGGDYWHTAAGRDRGRFSNQSALTDSRGSPDVDDAAGAVERLVEDPADRVEFPGAPNESRLAAAKGLMLRDGQQSSGLNRNVGTLDEHLLRIAQHHGIVDQTGR